MKAYEISTVSKKTYTISIASSSSLLAQFFRTIQSLITLLPGKPNDRKLAIGSEEFASLFADKVLSLAMTSQTYLIQ